MCGNCKNGKCKGMCTMAFISKILVIIGGINWGLVGIGTLVGSLSSWNLVDLIFGPGSIIGSIIYILVGLSAIAMIFGCKCGKCVGVCKVEPTAEPNIEEHM
jgi:uncharacterized protein